MRWTVSILCLLFFCRSLPGEDVYRLPSNARPLSYDLRLTLDPAQDSFTGEVRIEVEITQPTNKIYLHAVDLGIDRVTIDGKASSAAPAGVEMIALSAEGMLKPGKLPVEIAFHGRYALNETRGIFKQKQGEDWYVFSQFEPTDARRAFPCFDEPGFKVPWTVTLRVPKPLLAFGNTRETTDAPTNSDKLKTVRFRTSKPLPSYLVAFVVGAFDVVEVGNIGRNRTPVRTITPRGDGSATNFANAVTAKVLPELERFFDSPYPYEKLDQVAVPETVSFGAMENPGLITYNGTSLLNREKEPNIYVQQSIAETIAHENAHQWFGNMVTPGWWDDIWLNEAFATWMESKILTNQFPELREELADIAKKSYAMTLDTLDSARRIRQPVNDRNDVTNAFDSITYLKGSAVIAMFENYVGEAKFRTGVQQYLKSHQWGSATAIQFLEAIGKASGKDVVGAFSTFLDRPGVPALHVEMRCGSNGARLAVSQERLLPLGSKGEREVSWQVPVCIRYGVGTESRTQCSVLRDRREEITLNGSSACPAWITADARAVGYYGVVYSDDLFAKLLEHTNALTPAEQMGLLKNTELLSRTGQISAATAISVFRRFATSPEPATLMAAADIASNLRKVVPSESLPAYERLLSGTFGQKIRELGYVPTEGESAEIRKLRGYMIGLNSITATGALACSPQAADSLNRWLQDRSGLSPDVVQPILMACARTGNKELFDSYRKSMLNATNSLDRSYLAASLGWFRKPELAAAGLNFLLDPEVDVRWMFPMIWSFPGRPEDAGRWWSFLRANYDALMQRFPAEGQLFLLRPLRNLCSEQDARDLRLFLGPRIAAMEGGPRELDQTEESVRLCEARLKKLGPELQAFLNKN